MLKRKSIFKIAVFLLSMTAITLMLIFPDICKSGVSRGMLICGNVIIPAIFPFMVCILLIIKTELSVKNKFFSKILYVVFGQNFDLFKVFVFSMIGGYPIGAKLINELCSQGKIDLKTANIMQMYCVNAGPAFIISAIGNGIFKSTTIGVILFAAHISASALIAIFTRKFIQKIFNNIKIDRKNKYTFSENFVLSTADAASSVMCICTYVILFSVLNSYIVYFFEDIPILKNIIYFTEVTSGVTYTNNVVFVSFLLGFAGISIWCQIFSLSDKAKVNFKLFILGRLLHGSISSVITLIILKIFKVAKTTVSNNTLSSSKLFYDNIYLSISLTIMLIVLCIYIYSKNYSRKIIEDMI